VWMFLPLCVSASSHAECSSSSTVVVVVVVVVVWLCMFQY